MDDRLKKIITYWLSDKGIDFNEENLSLFTRKSFKRFKTIYKNAIKYISEKESKNFIFLNTIWKANIVFSRLVFKYSLFLENYLEMSIENISYCRDLQTRAKEYFDKMQLKIKDIGKNNTEKIKKVNKENKIISTFMMNKDFKDIKFRDKIIIYKHLIKEDDSFKLPIEKVEKIRTLRNKSSHHEFILDHFIMQTDNIKLLEKCIDKPYNDQFKEEIEKIKNKYGIGHLFVYNINS